MVENLNDKIVTSLRNTQKITTATELAKQFSVSERTIRRRIVFINDTILKDMAIIKSFPGKGYKLEVIDLDSFTENYDYLVSDTSLSNILNRRASIFQTLVNFDYANKWELMDQHFISETTLIHDINELNILNRDVDVKIRYKKEVGYHLQGSEYHIRNTLLRLIYSSGSVRIRHREHSDSRRLYKNMLNGIFIKSEIYVNKHILDAILNYILISTAHISIGRKVENISDSDQVHINEKLLELSENILKEMTLLNGCVFDDKETRYFAFFLKGNIESKNLSNEDTLDRFGLQAQRWTQIALSVLNQISTKNSNLKEVSSEIFEFFYAYGMRVELNIQRRNMAKETIESTYKVAYSVSKTIFSNIHSLNQISVSDEEIAYFSLIIHAHYIEVDYSKKSILVILPSDYVVTRILKVQFDKLYKCFINYKDFSYTYHLKDEEIKEYDVVVNTYEKVFDIKGDNVITIFEVLSLKDIQKVYRMLTFSDYRIMRNFIQSIVYKNKKYYSDKKTSLKIEYQGIKFVIDNTSEMNQIVIYSNNESTEIDTIEIRRYNQDLDVTGFIKIILDIYRTTGIMEPILLSKLTFESYL